MKTPYWFLRKTPLAIILVPVSWIYYIISRAVFIVRRAGAIKSHRTIVCVGNILAGGVGKTPVVRAIANYFDAPVVMRGYKSRARDGYIGDEATMLARDGLAVHTGDRKSNILLLNRQRDDTGPIVMDDGFQNPSIVKDVTILVFDQSIGYGNGFMLPAGPLRQPKRAARRADAIIVISGAKKPRKFKLPRGVPVFYATSRTVNPYDDDTPVVAFAGIGYPDKFFAAMPNAVATRAFPDHYQYTDRDLQDLFALARQNNARLVTTEKDWVRLPENVRDEIKYAQLDTFIDSAFWGWLKERVK